MRMPNLRVTAAGLAAAAITAFAAPAAEASFGAGHGLSPHCPSWYMCAQQPAAVMDANGTTFTLWGRSLGSTADSTPGSTVEGRTLSPANQLGTVQTIASPNAMRPVLGALPRGGALIGWTTGLTGPLRARTRSADGTLGAIQQISAGTAHDTRLFTNRAGQAVFTWSEPAGDWSVKKARTRSASGALSPIRLLTSSINAGSVTAALARNGDALVVWSDQGLKARSLSADGTLGQVEPATPAGAYAESPQVAIDYTGVARIVYWASEQLWLRSRSTAGAYDAPRAVPAAGKTGQQGRLAAAPGGGVEMVWLQSPLTSGRGRVAARTVRSNGTLSAVQELGTGDNARIAAGGQGRSAVVWRQRVSEEESRLAMRRRTSTTLAAIEPAPHGAAGSQIHDPAIATNLTGQVTISWQEEVESTLNENGAFVRVFSSTSAP